MGRRGLYCAMVNLWVILAYLFILIGVGVYRSKQVRTQDDFMVTGQGLSTKVLIGTLLATWIGSGSIIAGAGTSGSSRVGIQP